MGRHTENNQLEPLSPLESIGMPSQYTETTLPIQRITHNPPSRESSSVLIEATYGTLLCHFQTDSVRFQLPVATLTDCSPKRGVAPADCVQCASAAIGRVARVSAARSGRPSPWDRLLQRLLQNVHARHPKRDQPTELPQWELHHHLMRRLIHSPRDDSTATPPMPHRRRPHSALHVEHFPPRPPATPTPLARRSDLTRATIHPCPPCTRSSCSPPSTSTCACTRSVMQRSDSIAHTTGFCATLPKLSHLRAVLVHLPALCHTHPCPGRERSPRL
jgi:hypothetical protein